MQNSDYVQFFETTVFAGPDRTAFSFMTFPVDDLSDSLRDKFNEKNSDFWKPGNVLSLFDGLDIRGIIWSDQSPGHEFIKDIRILPYMIAALGSDMDSDDMLGYVNDAKDGNLYSPNNNEQLLNTSKELVNWPIIPTKKSPLFEKSLTEILKSESGVSIGAAVGFLVGWEFPPILFITVPIGIFICSSAIGIAKANEKGLYDKICEWYNCKKTK
jgi:hypothetical protein